MRHWITDVPMYPIVGYDGAQSGAWFLFHFLRVLDWDLVAECDTVNATSNHVVDGSMDADNVTNWSVVGTATRSKSTEQIHEGYRSLTFTAAAVGDGIQSAVFTNMEASQVYSFSMWVWNNTGHALSCYVDRGNGSWALLGSVANNAGVWTRSRWSWTSHTVVTACKFKLVDEVGTVGSGQVYVGSVYTTRSWFESKIRGSGIDGVVEAGNNKFVSASYSFTDSDITNGFVCFVDRATEGNSGIYRIVGRDGAKAILDIRDDATNFLTAAVDLTFRVLNNLDVQPRLATGSSSMAGYCLESPHSSKWRFKYRARWGYYPPNPGILHCPGQWASSPDRCDLNVDTFQFYKQKRSTARSLELDTGPTGWSAQGMFGTYGADAYSRYYCVTDGETYFLGLHRLPTSAYHSAYLIGFLGDNYIPQTDTFVHMQQHLNDTNADLNYPVDSLVFTDVNSGWAARGCGFGKRGLAARACVGSAGYGLSTSVTEYMTNAKANPWSGKESVRPVFAFVDYNGVLGEFASIESTIHDFGHCRANLPTWSHFGTNKEWFHAKSGLCIAWHGRGVQP